MDDDDNWGGKRRTDAFLDAVRMGRDASRRVLFSRVKTGTPPPSRPSKKVRMCNGHVTSIMTSGRPGTSTDRSGTSLAVISSTRNGDARDAHD